MKESIEKTDQTELSDRLRATVNTTPDGEVLGVALFLDKDALEALGVDDADHVQYEIKNENLQLHKV